MNGERETARLSRRGFVKGTALAALATAASTSALGSLYGCDNNTTSETATPEEKVVWSVCSRDYGCGAVMCPLQFHTVNGEVTYVESDNTGSSKFGDIQARACLRGRSVKSMLNHPDRLQYPMKRVGKRGEGEFERITWDEALELFTEKLKYTIDTYGNEAVSRSTGGPTNTGPFARLMNLIGGHLGAYGSDSCGQIMEGSEYLFSMADGMGTSSLIEATNADLLLMFGNSPADTAMGGGSACYDLARVRESGTKIINIDQRMNETCSAHPDEWLPIMNGTDAALCSAINYILINEGLADEDFLHEYCIGYDEINMPEGAPPNSSYKDYLFGIGYDMVAKTPEWASPITRIPVEKIYELARDIGNAKSVFVTQGWGPQRHTNGENACRAIMMVAVVSGNIGLPGTNTGGRDMRYNFTVPAFSDGIPCGDNPVKTQISTVMRFEAVARGEEMTALRDGVRGKDKLDTGIKFLVFHDVNTANQSQDLNYTHDALVDESKCEFIVDCDIVMTPSAKYADLLLPDAAQEERARIISLLTAGSMEGVIFGQPVQKLKFECRNKYDFFADVAERFGVRDEYTEGRTWEEWQHYSYAQATETRPDLPTLEEGLEMGLWKQELTLPPAMSAFRGDPVTNPLGTPSGKVEIYSPRLQEIAATWELDDPKDIISPIPIYNPGFEGCEDVTDEYPLILSGWHPKQRSHSTFGGVKILDKAITQSVWINPVDAESRGISNGDMTRVFTKQGEVHIIARVTPRIIPGVIAMPQGAWHKADMNGDRIDEGGNINVLTNRHWSPLAKHNPSHNSIAQIEKL